MIRIAEDDFGVEIGFECFETNAFDCAGSADRHEHRCFNLAAPRRQHTHTRLAATGLDLEFCWSHYLCVFAPLRANFFLCFSTIRNGVAKKSNSSRKRFNR